ncbi:MAG: hypothetical protein AAF234_06565 [Pseudomonadota bacterium]
MVELYKDKFYTVTRSNLRTPRQNFVLSKIEHVSLRNPFLLLGIPLGLACVGPIIAFGRYLYLGEIVMLALTAAGLLFAALQFGVLKVHSLALREGDAAIIGQIATLKKVRKAVEQAIELREQANADQ